MRVRYANGPSLTNESELALQVSTTNVFDNALKVELKLQFDNYNRFLCFRVEDSSWILILR